MTTAQRLTIEASEKREKARTLLDKGESMADAERAELDATTKRLQSLEAELRAAMVLEAADDGHAGGTPEGRELRALVDGADVGEIVAAVLGHRLPEGRTAELQAHFGLAGNQIPLAMLRMEQRAVTPAPSDVGTNQQPVVGYIFPQSVC